MKLLLTVLLTGAALFAQAPPPAKSATKAPAARKAAARPAAKSAAAAPELFRVRFATTKGDFVVEVRRDWAPLGADHFYRLVRARYFDNAPFFRVVPNFIVQFGLAAHPATTKAWDKPFKDDPVKQKNVRGTIVYATAGPNTRTTQFFINLRDNSSSLDKDGFAPFGTVSEGMEIVDQLFSGYGDDPDMGGRGPRQELVKSQGKAYTDKNFPKLDSIKTATIVFPETAAPATKAAPKAAPKAGVPAAKKAAPAAPAKKQ